MEGLIAKYAEQLPTLGVVLLIFFQLRIDVIQVTNRLLNMIDKCMDEGFENGDIAPEKRN